jgi:uncharacterized membrane protein (UPF0127 family)
MLQRITGRKREMLCSRVVFRRSFLSQGTGLTFHRRMNDEAHVFVFRKPRKVALTMFFVFFPIDVIFLDEKKRIVEIKENFRPFTEYYPKKKALFVVELPAGTIKMNGLREGNSLDF